MWHPLTMGNRTSLRHRVTWLVVAALLVGCSAGLDVAPVDRRSSGGLDLASAGLDRSDCVFDPPAVVETACYTLRVPQRWDDPGDSTTVEIPVAVFSTPTSAGSTVVYLEGGPGGDALALASLSFDQTWSDIVAAHKLVIFDQRGAGSAEPSLPCRELSDLVVPAMTMGPAEESVAVVGAIGACFDRLRDAGVDPAGYNSVQSAHDVEALRLALDEDPWDVVGVSYGTRLGQTLVREHPEGVRAMVLDGVQPIDGSQASIPASADRAITELVGACEADPVCAREWPGLGSRLFELAARLDDRPLTFRVGSPATGERFDATWDGGDLLTAVFTMLYTRESIADIGYLVAQLEAGDTSGASLLTALAIAQDQYVSSGMFWAVVCHEEVPFTTPADYARGRSGNPAIDETFAAGQADADDTAAICGRVGAGSADTIENVPVTSDRPVLVLSGQFDPITPPSDGAVVADRFGAQHVVLANMGHGAIAHRCGRSLILAFLARPSEPVDASCAALVEPIDWLAAMPTQPLVEVVFDPPFGAAVATALPDDWVVIPGVAAAEARPPLRQGQVAFLTTPSVTAPLTIDVLFGSLQLADQVELGSFTLGGVEWTGASGGFPGAVIDVWSAEFEDDTIVVIAQMPPGQVTRFRRVVESVLGSTRPA